MRLFIDSFWRAAAYCLHPRVIALSFLPLVLLVALALGLGYFYWQAALGLVDGWLQGSTLITGALAWLQDMGAGALSGAVAPLIVVITVAPLLVMLSLLAVALLMTPALVSLVAERRFPQLERKRGGGWFSSLAWSLGSLVLALVALVVSMPLWLIPPLVLVLPPLVWGWLTYRVMAYDALADHASREERQQLFARHRGWLLAIGVLSGFLGAAPSLVWASGVMFAVAFPVLMPVALWLYTLVFAYSSLWFNHFALAALQELRAESAAAAVVGPARTPIPPASPVSGPAGASPQPLELLDGSAHDPIALPDARKY